LACRVAVGLALMFVMTGVAHFVPGMRATDRDRAARLPKPALLVWSAAFSNSLARPGCSFRRRAWPPRHACSC
jgi:hypothetical protein